MRTAGSFLCGGGTAIRRLSGEQPLKSSAAPSVMPVARLIGSMTTKTCLLAASTPSGAAPSNWPRPSRCWQTGSPGEQKCARSKQVSAITYGIMVHGRGDAHRPPTDPTARWTSISWHDSVAQLRLHDGLGPPSPAYPEPSQVKLLHGYASSRTAAVDVRASLVSCLRGSPQNSTVSKWAKPPNPAANAPGLSQQAGCLFCALSWRQDAGSAFGRHPQEGRADSTTESP